MTSTVYIIESDRALMTLLQMAALDALLRLNFVHDSNIFPR